MRLTGLEPPPPPPPPSPPSWIAAFLSVFNALTLQKVLVWGLFVAITGGSYVLYLNQNMLVTGWVSRTTLVPLVVRSPEGKLREEMMRFVDSNPDVVGLQVVDVDLVLNTRTTVWYYSDEPALTKLHDAYLHTKLGPTPWVSGSPDFISLTLGSAVNSTFLCIPIKDTPLSKRVVGIDRYVTTLCVSPIPPPYASFSGYISAWLVNPLDDAVKQQQLALQLRAYAAQLQPKQ